MRALLLNLPYSIKGFIKKTAEPDGDYVNIVINARLSYDAQQAAYSHELTHLEQCDLDRIRSADVIESICHGEGQ